MGANETWSIEFSLIHRMTGGNSGMRVAIDVPAGGSVNGTVYGVQNNLTSTVSSILSGDQGQSSTMNTAQFTGWTQVRAVVTAAGTSGTVTVQVRVIANTIDVAPGSYFNARKM